MPVEDVPNFGPMMASLSPLLKRRVSHLKQARESRIGSRSTGTQEQEVQEVFRSSDPRVQNPSALHMNFPRYGIYLRRTDDDDLSKVIILSSHTDTPPQSHSPLSSRLKSYLHLLLKSRAGAHFHVGNYCRALTGKRTICHFSQKN